MEGKCSRRNTPTNGTPMIRSLTPLQHSSGFITGTSQRASEIPTFSHNPIPISGWGALFSFMMDTRMLSPVPVLLSIDRPNTKSSRNLSSGLLDRTITDKTATPSSATRPFSIKKGNSGWNTSVTPHQLYVWSYNGESLETITAARCTSAFEILMENKNYITIDGFEIRYYQDVAITIQRGPTHVRVINCDIHHNMDTGIGVRFVNSFLLRTAKSTTTCKTPSVSRRGRIIL